MQASDMRTRVKRYLDRDDLDSDINDWMQDARQDLALTYNFHYLYKEATTNVSAGQNRYALSSDYLDHLTMFYMAKKLGRVGAGTFDDMAWVATHTSAASGEPEYYVLYGREIEVHPTPNATTTADGGYLKIRYYSKAPSLTSDSDEDEMAIHHYEAIIYGACVRGSLFLNDTENTQRWQREYERQKKLMLKREKDRELTDDRSIRFKHWSDYDPDVMRRIYHPEGGVTRSEFDD